MTRITCPAGAMNAAPMPEDFGSFLMRLGDRDRQNVERHVSFCEAEPTEVHGELWKRLTCMLAGLAPYAAHTVGQRAVRFYVSDGKYRLQIFALEDLRDGNLAIYAGDALAAALHSRVIRGPIPGDGDVTVYEVADEPGAMLQIELLTAANTASAPEYYKHMLGWNRKALKITLPVTAGPVSIRALEALCVLSMRKIDG